MTPARDVAEFVARPLGRCVHGPGFVIWCEAPDLAGSIQWGELDERCVRDMLAAAEFIASPALAPRGRVLMDCRDVERVDTDALIGFTERARERLPAWSARIERQVVVLPGGLSGVLLAGALPSLAPTHALRFVGALDTAFDLLAHPAARGAHAAATGHANDVRGRALFITRVRAHLARDLLDPSVRGCATALGVSSRTLQRELRRLATSFSGELRRARVAAAEELLLHSDLKVEAIATRVGFGTASRMSLMLRRERSLTPRELRARGRR